MEAARAAGGPFSARASSDDDSSDDSDSEDESDGDSDDGSLDDEKAAAKARETLAKRRARAAAEEKVARANLEKRERIVADPRAGTDRRRAFKTRGLRGGSRRRHGARRG